MICLHPNVYNATQTVKIGKSKNSKDTKEKEGKKEGKKRWQSMIGKLTTRRRVRRIITIFVRMKVHGMIFLLSRSRACAGKTNLCSIETGQHDLLKSF